MAVPEPVPKQLVLVQYSIPLDFDAKCSNDIWIDVTNLGGAVVSPGVTGTVVTYPDIKRVKVDITAREGITESSSIGAFGLQSIMYAGTSDAAIYTSAIPALAASRKLGLDRSREADTPEVVPSFSKKSIKVSMVNLSTIDADNKVVDEKYGASNPPYVVLFDSTSTTAKIFAHCGKLTSFVGGYPTANALFIAQATVYVWYARQVREQVTSNILAVANTNPLTPSYPVVISKAQIQKIRSKTQREAALLAYNSGYDVSPLSGDVKSFFQHVVSFVKQALPIAVTLAGMLKQEQALAMKPVDATDGDIDTDDCCEDFDDTDSVPVLPGAVKLYDVSDYASTSSPRRKKQKMKPAKPGKYVR